MPCLDQSVSMVIPVVYASIFAAVTREGHSNSRHHPSGKLPIVWSIRIIANRKSANLSPLSPWPCDKDICHDRPSLLTMAVMGFETSTRSLRDALVSIPGVRKATICHTCICTIARSIRSNG